MEKGETYSGLQCDASSVWAILGIAYMSRAKTSFAPTEKRAHTCEHRGKPLVFPSLILWLILA